jgi:predicted nucleic acid-binding protein
MAQGA